MTDRELMQMVLEELEELADVNYGSKTVLQALRDRLAQPEPEPVLTPMEHLKIEGDYAAFEVEAKLKEKNK